MTKDQRNPEVWRMLAGFKVCASPKDAEPSFGHFVTGHVKWGMGRSGSARST